MLRRVKNQDIFFRLEKPTFVKRTQILITYKNKKYENFAIAIFGKFIIIIYEEVRTNGQKQPS